MKRVLTTISILAIIFTLRANHWEKTYGQGEGTYVQQTEDGGYIIAGTELIKTDKAGEVEWRKDFGSDCYCVDETSDGGYVVFSSIRDAQINEVQMWILKLDSAGDTVWTRLYGGEDLEYPSEVEGGYIEQVSDGGYVAVCKSFVRTDSLGELQYYQHYNTYLDCFNCSSSSSYAHYMVAFFDTLIEVDNKGEILWGTDILYGMNGGPWDIKQAYFCFSYRYIAAGNTWGPGSDTSPHSDAYIVEFNDKGRMLWDDMWGEVQNMEEQDEWEQAFCIQPIPPDSSITSIGEYIVCGTDCLRQYMLLDQDIHVLMWEREHEGNLYHVEQTTDSGYIITGKRDGEILLIKTDPEGFVEGIEEEPINNTPPDFKVTSVGSSIVLQYSDYPEGLSAQIFDASGRKVDEIHFNKSSGSLTWGDSEKAGIYFIRVITGSSQTTRKAMLIK